jgi:hypothetical protein
VTLSGVSGSPPPGTSGTLEPVPHATGPPVTEEGRGVCRNTPSPRMIHARRPTVANTAEYCSGKTDFLMCFHPLAWLVEVFVLVVPL